MKRMHLVAFLLVLLVSRAAFAGSPVVGAVTNGASFVREPVSACEIATVWGENLASQPMSAESLPLPVNLNGTEVSFGGLRAPLFYASSSQLNVQVPCELGLGKIQVSVRVNGVTSSSFEVDVVPATPGCFTVNSSGAGQGAILTLPDWKLAAAALDSGKRSAKAGEYITVFCTGLGGVTNRPQTGEAALTDPLSETALPVSATIGGVEANVSFAGLTSQFVGLYQVNVQVPENAPNGASVPIQISVAGVVSNETTMAIGDFPLIMSVTPPAIYCGRECVVGPVTITGSGFYDGGTMRIDNGVAALTIPLSNPNPNQLRLSFMAFDTPHYDPGFFDFTVTNPEDRGGGISNVKRPAFLGNQNTLALPSTQAFQLDQVVGLVRKFRLSDGSANGGFSVSSGTRGIAYDGQTDRVAISLQSIVDVYTTGSKGVASAAVSSPVMAVAASGGQSCFTEDTAGNLSCFNLKQINPKAASIAVGDRPWNVAMTNLQNDGLVAAVFMSGDLALSVVKVTPVSAPWPANGAPPQLQFLRSIVLAGLTSSRDVRSPNGGSQLAVFDSGPQSGKAVVLHQADKVLVYVDLATAQAGELVHLDGFPFRLAADNANGNAIVALADTEAGLTRFVKVAPDGAVTPLNSTWDKLATGLGVSADGTKLYVANRNQFRILPNQ